MKYSQATNARDRKIFSQKMMRILKNQNSPTVIENSDEFISDPLFPRILSLFSYEDIDNTIETYAKILKLPQEKIEMAFQTLEKLGLIKRFSESGRWISQIGFFKIPEDKGNRNLQRFHEKSLAEALKAFDHPKEVRSYRSLLLPMNSEEFNLFLENLDSFAKDQVNLHSPNKFQDRRLFQMNFNVYPVSDSVNPDKEKIPSL